MPFLNRCACGVCHGPRFLIDGSFASGPETGGVQLARYWGGLMQAMFNSIGLGWEVVYYPDVAGPGFDLNDYSGIHLIIPLTDPAWLGDFAAWVPAGGFPKRLIIHGDANGDTTAPYDYGTANVLYVAALGSSLGFSVGIGVDANVTEEWNIFPGGFEAGISGTLSVLASSIVAGGTRIAYIIIGEVSRVTMAHETVAPEGGTPFSVVVAGTPSWLFITGPDSKALMKNLHTVAVF